MKLLALYHTPDEKEFLEHFSETFKDLYQISIICLDNYSKQAETGFSAILSWQMIQTDLPFLNLAPLNLFEQEQPCQQVNLALAHALVTLSRQIELRTLESFPYQASLYDTDGQLISSNNKPEDPFDLLENSNAPLPKWILEQLTANPTKTFYTTQPSLSFNHILTQTYQPYQNNEGQIMGILQYVQDIKPLLKTYLDETGQALVGWSDVTSGASIHNDTIDFE